MRDVLQDMVVFTAIASLVSRRLAFFFAFLAGMIVTAFIFNSLQTATDAYWMLPMMGFAQLALFAGYSIYFPELFPTRLRGTGALSGRASADPAWIPEPGCCRSARRRWSCRRST